MSKVWAESQNLTVGTGESRTFAVNILDSIATTNNICPLNGNWSTPTEDGAYPIITKYTRYSDNRPLIHEALLASLIANGMSHAGDWQSAWFTKSSATIKGGRWLYNHSTPAERQEFLRDQTNGTIVTFHRSLPGVALTIDGGPSNLPHRFSSFIASTSVRTYCIPAVLVKARACGHYVWTHRLFAIAVAAAVFWSLYFCPSY